MTTGRYNNTMRCSRNRVGQGSHGVRLHQLYVGDLQNFNSRIEAVFLLNMRFEMFHKSGNNLLPFDVRGAILRHPEAAYRTPGRRSLAVLSVANH
jgi:hypothetical protein